MFRPTQTYTASVPLLLALACAPIAPAEPEVSVAQPVASPEGLRVSQSAAEPLLQEVKESEPEPDARQELQPVAEEKGVFPPPSPGPAHERSARPGDGKWRPFFSEDGDAELSKRMEVESAPEFGSDWVQRMVIHPHKASRFQSLTVAAFDLEKLALFHRPGASDIVDVGRGDLSEQSGLVPESQRASLVAVFNGGFQPRHGRWGMFSLGEQLIAARDDACTVGVTSEHRLAIGPWPALENAGLAAYRQTPPCLVSEGELHPLLQKGDRRPWAGQHADRKTRRRSAIGLSKDGRTLFYGVGTETEPEVLAAGMLFAGAHAAAQLDINWNWTRLFLFEEREGRTQPVGALLKEMAKDRGEYVSRPAKRGFFWLGTRDK